MGSGVKSPGPSIVDLKAIIENKPIIKLAKTKSLEVFFVIMDKFGITKIKSHS
ncbi:hypothetical protein MHTCC0001_33780 [Flavobacteriaceae bacterium MHTCC 0001]